MTHEAIWKDGNYMITVERVWRYIVSAMLLLALMASVVVYAVYNGTTQSIVGFINEQRIALIQQLMTQQEKDEIKEKKMVLFNVTQELNKVSAQLQIVTKERDMLHTALKAAIIPETTVKEAFKNHIAVPVSDTAKATGVAIYSGATKAVEVINEGVRNIHRYYSDGR